MALDNIELDNLQAGDDVATDIINTDHYQYVKMTFGAAGTANEVTSTATNPFPVALSDTDNAVLDTINTAAEAVQTAVEGTLTVGSHAVTNAGTFDVQIADTSFAVADGNALGEGVLIQGDDGTDRKNINVDATTGDVQVDVTNTVTVTATNLDVQSGGADLATAAGQLPDGHNVTIDNASGASAVNIQDGGNSITVDGTVTANPASGTIDTVTNLAQMGGVAITRDNGVSGTGVQRVTIASDSTGQVKLAAGTAEIGKLAAGTAAIGKLAANSGVDIGDVDVLSSALPTGAATSANQDARATGGMSFHMLAMAAADNDAIIKASAATVYFVSIQSIDATPVYLKLFNAASITPGTTAADLQFMAPSQGDANGSGLTLNFGPHGIQFDTGLCALVATGIATDDNTAVSANEVIVTIGYE